MSSVGVGVCIYIWMAMVFFWSYWDLNRFGSGGSSTEREELALRVASCECQCPGPEWSPLLVFVCVVCVWVFIEFAGEWIRNQARTRIYVCVRVSQSVVELFCVLFLSDNWPPPSQSPLLFVFLVPGPSEIQTVLLHQTQKGETTIDELEFFKAEKRNLHSQVSTDVCTGVFMPILGSPLLLFTLTTH